jgi:hypothetical protein
MNNRLSEWKNMEDSREKYQAYLCSPEWWEKRSQAINNAKGRCEKCYSKAATCVHHLTYARKYNELPKDLMALCDDCHETIHAKSEKQPPKDQANQSANTERWKPNLDCPKDRYMYVRKMDCRQVEVLKVFYFLPEETREVVNLIPGMFCIPADNNGLIPEVVYLAEEESDWAKKNDCYDMSWSKRLDAIKCWFEEQLIRQEQSRIRQEYDCSINEEEELEKLQAMIALERQRQGILPLKDFT